MDDDQGVTFEDATGAPPAPAAAPSQTQTAPAPGSEGRTVTVRPRAPPKPPPAPIVPHETAPVSVQPKAVAPAAAGQEPPPDEGVKFEDATPTSPYPGLGVDLAKSGWGGLAEGTEGLLGTPHDIPKFVDYGLDWAGAHLAQAVGGPPAEETLKASQGSALRMLGMGHLVDAFADNAPPGAADYQRWFKQAGLDPGYKPQTGAGRYVHEIAAFAPTALIGGVAGIPARLASTVLPAIGSETLGNLTKDTSWEPWARGFGALVGGGAHIVGSATKDAINEYRKPITEAGQKDLAAQQFRAQTSEPDAALQKLRDAQAQRQPGRATGENIPGSRPTTGQVTGDLGQLGMERAVQAASPELHAGQMTAQRAAQSKALGTVQPTGAPETVSDLITKRLADIDAEHEASVTGNRQMHEEIHGATHERMSQEAAGAEQQARTAAGKVARRGDPEALGEKARGALAESMAKAKKQEKRLWDAIQADKIGVQPHQIGGQARRIQFQVGKMQRPMEGDEKRIFDNAATLTKKWTKLSDITDLRSDLTTAMRQERITNGSTPALKRMTELLKTTDNVIKNAATRQSAKEAEEEMGRLRAMTPQDRANVVAARAASRARGDIERGPAGAIVRKGATSDSYRTMSSQVPGKVFAAGPTGGQKLKAYTAATGTMDPVHDIVSDSLAREATTDGVIDPKKLKAWQEKHGPALATLPDEVRQKFVGGEADAAAALAEGAATRRENLVAHSKLQVGKEFDKQLAQGSPLAKAMRADPAFKGLEGATSPKTVQNTIGGLLERKDAVETMQRLAREVAGNPQAADGLKRAILDHTIEKITSMTEAGTTGVDALKPGRAQAFILAKRDAFKAAGFSDAQLAALDGIAADIKRQQRFYATKAAGQSNTPQDLLKHLKEHAASAHEGGPLTNLFAIKEGIEAAHGFGIPKGVSIPAGVGIAAGKHFFGKARNAGLKNVADIIQNAVMNPDQAEHLLNRPPKLHGRGSQATLARKWERQAMYAGLAAERTAALNH